MSDTYHEISVVVDGAALSDVLVEEIIDAIDKVLTEWFDGSEDTPDWDFSASLKRHQDGKKVSL